MKHRLMKKGMSWLLIVVMVLGMCPITIMADSEAGKIRSVNLDISYLSPKDNVWNSTDGYKLYYGSYGGTTTAFRVLSADNEKILLDCNTMLFKKAFDEDGVKNAGQKNSPSEWVGSDLELYLNGMNYYNNSSIFTTQERMAIMPTYLKSDYFEDSETTDHIFLLSAKEFNKAYGMNYGTNGWLKTNAKASSETGGVVLDVSSAWTLREGIEKDFSGLISTEWGSGLDSENAYYAINVLDFGYCLQDGIQNALNISPAFYVDSSSVIFTSPLGVDKASAFEMTKENDSKDWNVTLKGGTGFKAEITTGNIVPWGSEITIDVSSLGNDLYGNAVSKNYYSQISAMLVDGNGTVLSYGKVKENATTGTFTFAMPQDKGIATGENYKLKIFAEKVNSSLTRPATDYASDIATFDIKVRELEKYTIRYDANGGNGSIDDDIATENRAYTMPECTITAPQGMRFVTWAIGSKDSEITRKSGEKFTFTKATTIYPIWEIIPTYTIESSISEKDFGIRNEGYSVPDEQEITITNLGNQTVTLTKNTLKNFDVSDFSKNQLAPNEKATFTVKPKTALVSGVYNETIVVKTAHDTEAKTTVQFKVNRKLLVLLNLEKKTITYGDSQSLVVNVAGGSEKYTYQWFEGNSKTAFSTEKSISATPEDDTVYKVVVSDGIEQRELTSTITVTPAIVYNANGGSGTMMPTILTKGESVTLTLPECTLKAPTGMFFKTWAIGSPDSKTTKNPGETYKFKKSTKIYAVWYDGLIWSDEFNGSKLDTSVWECQKGNGSWGWGNGEVQYYTDRQDNVKVSDGSLQITAKKEKYQGYNYTSGRINSMGKKAFKYGLIEARIKVDNGNQDGVWPAFWMMGNNMNDGVEWPNCGEIDIMEHANSDNFVSSCLHWNYNGINGNSQAHGSYGSGSAGKNYVFENNEKKGINGWHIYGVLWDENHMEWQVDGQTYFSQSITTSNAYCFKKDQFILFNLAIGGTGSGFTGNVTANPNTYQTTTMYVDYVRVYKAGSKGSVGAPLIAPEVTKKAPAETTTQEPTTSLIKQPETVTYKKVEQVDAILTSNRLFTTYVGSGWAGSAIKKTEPTVTGVEIEVEDAGENIMGLQAHSEDLSVVSGNTYSLKTTLESDIDKTVMVAVNGYGREELEAESNIETTEEEESTEFESEDETTKPMGEEETAKQTDEDEITESMNENDTTTSISKVKTIRMMSLMDFEEDDDEDEEEDVEEDEVDNTFFVKMIHLKAGEPYVLEEEVTIPEDFDGTVDIDYAFGKDVEEDLEGVTFTLKISNTSFTTMQTLLKSEIVPTTPVKANKQIIAKAVVKKVEKKKSAKKVSITLSKKLKGVQGYQIQFYRTKNDAKNNKKVLVRIRYKKNEKQFSVKNKKLRNKKTLYVRIRGYRKIKRVIVYGKWSKVKKVVIIKPKKTVTKEQTMAGI